MSKKKTTPQTKPVDQEEIIENDPTIAPCPECGYKRKQSWGTKCRNCGFDTEK